MRTPSIYGAVLLLAIPALGHAQQTKPAPSATVASSANDPSADYVTLRDRLAAMNKELTGEVASQRALVKHNQELLKDAEKLDASNKKMEAEKQKLAAQNADLQKHRDALKASTAATETAALQVGGK